MNTLIWYSWLGGIIIGTMIGANMVLEEHCKAGPRNVVVTGRQFIYVMVLTEDNDQERHVDYMENGFYDTFSVGSFSLNCHRFLHSFIAYSKHEKNHHAEIIRE